MMTRLRSWLRRLTSPPAPTKVVGFDPETDPTIKRWRSEREESRANTLHVMRRGWASVPVDGTGNVFEDELFGPQAHPPR